MILELKNISLSFSSQRKDSFKILNGLSLAVSKEKITALVGGNGAGKTTLFNIISGFQSGYSGEVLFNGSSLENFSPDKRARAGIGRLFQGRQLMTDLTLLENMKIASDNRSGETPFTYLFHKKRIDTKEKEKEEEAIEIFDRLFGKENKYASMLHQKAATFSYGEQRLIGLARLLMGKYSLLLLDEPTAGVNPVYIEAIKEVILKIVKEEKISVLLIEHNMHFVRESANYCAYLDDGVIKYQGTTDKVLSNQDVKNSYLGL